MALPTIDKDRKGEWPLWTFMFGYFPKAWLEVVRVAVEGNKQHNPGQPLHWAREKSTDQLNTAFRHLFDYGTGVKKDTDGVYHLAKAIWRLSAQLQLDIEKDETAEAAPSEKCRTGYKTCRCKICVNEAVGAAPGPKAGVRDTSQPLPADVIQKTCKCGDRVFAYREGDLPPQVCVQDKSGQLVMHSPKRCGDV